MRCGAGSRRIGAGRKCFGNLARFQTDIQRISGRRGLRLTCRGRGGLFRQLIRGGRRLIRRRGRRRGGNIPFRWIGNDHRVARVKKGVVKKDGIVGPDTRDRPQKKEEYKKAP